MRAPFSPRNAVARLRILSPWLGLVLLLAGGCGPSGDDDANANDAGSSTTDASVVPDGGRWTDTGLRPSGRFLEIWNDLDAGDGDLGYPLAEQLHETTCAWQPFATGWMLWVESRSVVAGCQEFCELARIFAVVYPGGNASATSGDTYYRHPDDWDETTMDEFSCTEADHTTEDVAGEAKPLGPIRGFGKVWCEQDPVHTGVGVALHPERGGWAFQDCQSQQFQGGLIVHNPNTEDASYWVFIWDAQWYRYAE